MKEQLDCNLARKHAAVVRRVVARHLERIAKLEALGFSTVRAEQALEVSSLAKNFAQLSLPFWLNLGALVSCGCLISPNRRSCCYAQSSEAQEPMEATRTGGPMSCAEAVWLLRGACVRVPRKASAHAAERNQPAVGRLSGFLKSTQRENYSWLFGRSCTLYLYLLRSLQAKRSSWRSSPVANATMADKLFPSQFVGEAAAHLVRIFLVERRKRCYRGPWQH
jgi:hypothetical protein